MAIPPRFLPKVIDGLAALVQERPALPDAAVRHPVRRRRGPGRLATRTRTRRPDRTGLARAPARVAVRRTVCEPPHAVSRSGAPVGAPGKAVRIRRDPVTVIGDETRERHWPLEGWEGAGSRTIREPGDLPGRASPHAGLRGRIRARWLHRSSFWAARAAARAASPSAGLPPRGRVAFVATAERGRRRHGARIARHRAERPPGLDHRGGAAGAPSRLRDALGRRRRPSSSTA